MSDNDEQTSGDTLSTPRANASDRPTDASRRTGASRRTFLKGTGALAAVGAFGSFGAQAHGEYPNRVVGYYPSWASDYGPEDVPFDQLTHFNFAFLEPESDGTVVLSDPDDDDLLQELADYDDEETVFQLAISGGWYPQEFSDAAATEENRKRFARTAVDHVETYGFDGLDIDWEFPDGTTRESDPENFTLLLEEIRNELDDRFGSWTHLTIAASPNANIADDAYEVETISDYLDHVNVMTYDYHGDWSSETNFNAPFDSPPEDPNGREDFNASHSMNHWADKPISNDKLVMGLPFYGRSYSGVADTNEGLFNSFDSSTSATYADISQNIEPQSDYEYHWHHDAKVPWVYSAADETFVAYDDEASISNKCRFVTDNGFGGVMCWELSQDSTNTLIARMHDEMHGDYSNTKFRLQDHTVTTGDHWVRDGPGTSSEHIDTAPEGTTGTVLDGPVESDGYAWYRISYDDGISDGWSAANALEAAAFDADHPAVTNADLWVRDGPGTSNEHIDTAPEGTGGTVLDGPVESDGYTWWRVDYDDGVSTGWSAGEYLDQSY
ncbi:glycosyl hydrolase family 18 protein [Halorussus amylolyticus]|uniref:glycosyl hydrolase family 18 protein n=1 Tax=Halorussus amylolyticus TaxID=1126242 RepID=UPI00104E25AB|nr:glycosyl hydrolase family 18 protein [Halorussus amylolyticus]